MVYFWLLKIKLIKIIKKGLTSSIGWNLGKKNKSIHLREPFTSTPIIGTKIKETKEIKKRINKVDGEIISIDGIRVQNNKGWFLIRASNTQNQLTCRAESISEKGLHKLIGIIEDQLSLSGIKYKFII